MVDEGLIRRVRAARSAGATLEQVHATIVSDGGVSEEDFYLAWRAADVLDGPYREAVLVDSAEARWVELVEERAKQEPHLPLPDVFCEDERCVGWAVFDTGGVLTVQKDDCCRLFSSDDEAAEAAREAGILVSEDYHHYVLGVSDEAREWLAGLGVG